MINHWDVINYISKAPGNDQLSIEEASEKLIKIRERKAPLINLEDNKKRLEYRFKREIAPFKEVLERINGSMDFSDEFVLDILSDKGKAVCRILENGAPIGTGFLVAENIILTNHHVIEDTNGAGNMFAEFDFELDKNHVPKKSTFFKLKPETFFYTSSFHPDLNDPLSGCDFTFIGVENIGTNNEDIRIFSPVSLDGNVGKIIKGEFCVIIQHPDGLPKKIVLKDISFFFDSENFLVYESDTLPGSSGAMVIALGTCEIIALHQAGQAKVDDQGRILTKNGQIANRMTPDSEIDWIGNKGIKISKILEILSKASLPSSMEASRNKILFKTKIVDQQLKNNFINPMNKMNTPLESNAELSSRDDPQNGNTILAEVQSPSTRANFLFTARYDDQQIGDIKSILQAKYGTDIELMLSMPASAIPGNIELFTLNVSFGGDIESEARNLTLIPGIFNAEADTPISLNTGTDNNLKNAQPDLESLLWEDGYGTNNEDTFICKYSTQSPYVIAKPQSEYRKWNWYATGFDKVINNDLISVIDQGIQIVQFDTGYTKHSKVKDAFDTDHDFSFLDHIDNAEDPRTPGRLKQPGHGTRTSSILIGHEVAYIDKNGNGGLLNRTGFKLIPFRIAQSVILINRQQQLAEALDLTITQNFDIITMSMGLPPTIATAVMAKKAYDAGVIWCCAAGNEVQAVVAPAVFPGTIAVAASNPLDEEWPGSSRGDSVDITAPGQDVYVPIFIKPLNNNSAPGEGMAYGDGTSYATPHVAAAAAYWLSKYKTDLEKLGCVGWKRVEAFRIALSKSARRSNQLPRIGFGHGILDADQLLKTKPQKVTDKDYAYNNWNESEMLQVIQAYGEMVKTYWNKIHNWIFGSPRGEQESLFPTPSSLSNFSKNLENALFTQKISSLEIIDSNNVEDLKQRLNLIVNKIESAAKK